MFSLELQKLLQVLNKAETASSLHHSQLEYTDQIKMQSYLAIPVASIAVI